MMLPQSKELPVAVLARCFNKTSATYKYYWMLSILQAAEEGTFHVSKKALFSRMIANAWFTVNYFKLSFGKHDLIQDAIRAITLIESITIDERQEVVFQKLLHTRNEQTNALLWHFNNNVPHWFLSPWFPNVGNESDASRRRRIYAASKHTESASLYALYDDYIEINPQWLPYLVSNAAILKNFCYWNLALFLQTKNPNVPDIPNKLIKPAIRSSLSRQRKQFWDIVIEELGTVTCIYTGQALTRDNYAVEHFIPYSFVSHDLVWNLIPADSSFNSSKSNKLPVLDRYFEPFYALQETAYTIVKQKTPHNKLLEDYLTVIHPPDESLNKAKFKDIIQPLVTIASNNGFQYMY